MLKSSKIVQYSLTLTFQKQNQQFIKSVKLGPKYWCIQEVNSSTSVFYVRNVVGKKSNAQQVCKSIIDDTVFSTTITYIYTYVPPAWYERNCEEKYEFIHLSIQSCDRGKQIKNYFSIMHKI